MSDGTCVRNSLSSCSEGPWKGSMGGPSTLLPSPLPYCLVFPDFPRKQLWTSQAVRTLPWASPRAVSLIVQTLSFPTASGSCLFPALPSWSSGSLFCLPGCPFQGLCPLQAWSGFWFYDINSWAVGLSIGEKVPQVGAQTEGPLAKKRCPGMPSGPGYQVLNSRPGGRPQAPQGRGLVGAGPAEGAQWCWLMNKWKNNFEVIMLWTWVATVLNWDTRGRSEKDLNTMDTAGVKFRLCLLRWKCHFSFLVLNSNIYMVWNLNWIWYKCFLCF